MYTLRFTFTIEHFWEILEYGSTLLSYYIHAHPDTGIQHTHAHMHTINTHTHANTHTVSIITTVM